MASPARTDNPPIPSPLPQRDLYSLTELSERGWGGRSTLRGYIADGLLPAVWVGGVKKVRHEDLHAFVKPVEPRRRTLEDAKAEIERIFASMSEDERHQLAVMVGGEAQSN
ncbi:MAG: DNA-binding protein [Propionibacteriaceae bacterium]|nr:DNA-binding protein [Propionibacteriaceae bacterium]